MTATAPIANLNDDVLLSIFDTITSQRPASLSRWSHRPVAIVWKAAQVCRRWRRLLLAAPWVWGRLIDLELLSDRRVLVSLDKITRRAGSAPLRIYGSLWVTNHESVRRFLELLESWERIEELGVRIYSYRTDIPDGIQRAFLSPAPALKVFDVYFEGVRDPQLLGDLRPGSSKPLFANHAPALRMIRSSPVSYTWNAPWLSNIREIKFFPSSFTVQDIFLLLERTPLIETIEFASHRLTGSEERPFAGPSHKLHLPHLTSLKMKTNLPAAAVILDHILPGSLSRLCINIDDPQTVDVHDPIILSSFKHGLGRHIASYFTTKPLKIVQLELTTEYSKGLRLCDATKPIDEYGSDKPDFEVVARNESRQLDDCDDLFACLLEAFTAALSDDLKHKAALETITQLRLSFLTIKPDLIPILYSFLVLFSHVREVEIDEKYICAMSSLDHWSDDIHRDSRSNTQPLVLFPQLHTLLLAPKDSFTSFILPDDLQQFVARRKTLGYPLTTLDLTRARKYCAHNLCDLEDVAGLEVVWSEQKTAGRKRKSGNYPSHGEGEGEEVCRYVCGTGRPSVLRKLVKRRRLRV